MDSTGAGNSQLLDALGDRFLLLIDGLIEGNRKRALALAGKAEESSGGANLSIVSQNLIEELAQSQAARNAFLNLPSVVPGLGTAVSLSLVAAENFYLLDQSVTLILALCSLHGKDLDDGRAVRNFTVGIIGEVFGVAGKEAPADTQSVSRSYVARFIPMKYLNRGLNRGMSTILKRLMPARRGSRLLPAGVGLGASALIAYDTIVSVGKETLGRLPGFTSDQEESRV
jgi:hypothetical protein